MAIEKKIYIDYNFNRNEVKQFLLENYDTMPEPVIGEDKGLIYYDTFLDRVMVWDGTVWKIVQYLDDRDIANTRDILVENLWVESDHIPGTYSIALTSTFVQVATASTTYIPKSYSFQMPADPKIVPSKYGNFYEPKLYTYDDILIPNGYNYWRLDDTTITFYGGFSTTPYLIDQTHPPKIVYWTYTGRVGSFNFVGGATNIVETNGSNIIPMPSFIRRNNIISVTVNGILIYAWDYNTVLNQLEINEIVLDYTLDFDDIIRIELNV